MNGMNVNEGVKSSQIEATIIRADGTREYLGVVSYWHKNWFMRKLYSVKNLFKRIKNRILK